MDIMCSEYKLPDGWHPSDINIIIFQHNWLKMSFLSDPFTALHHHIDPSHVSLLFLSPSLPLSLSLSLLPSSLCLPPSDRYDVTTRMQYPWLVGGMGVTHNTWQKCYETFQNKETFEKKSEPSFPDIISQHFLANDNDRDQRHYYMLGVSNFHQLQRKTIHWLIFLETPWG